MKLKNKVEQHPFKDFLPKGVKYLIIGSFPGPKKIWKTPWFYGSKYSQFWKIMEVLYGRSYKLGSFSEKRNLFFKLNVGVTDIFKAVKRVKGNASDGNLVPVKYNEILALLQRHKSIKKVLFTSVFARDHYEKRFPLKNNAVSFVTLPSPSPRYAKVSLQKKINSYRKYFPKPG